ncbi:MAG: TadE/TadG family type IV pilus assembly protein, partial [Planctomycetaceae bacterium]
AAVEFALVLPLVLVVVLGLVQVGLVARDRLLVEAAARAGARAAAVGPDEAAIADTAIAAAPGLDPALASVSVVRTGGRGDPVTVSVVYDDPVRVPLVGWLVGAGVTMTASATDRQEFG